MRAALIILVEGPSNISGRGLNPTVFPAYRAYAKSLYSLMRGAAQQIDTNTKKAQSRGFHALKPRLDPADRR
jgi:hypothetical protein